MPRKDGVVVMEGSFYTAYGDILVFAACPLRALETVRILTALGVALAPAERPSDVLQPGCTG